MLREGKKDIAFFVEHPAYSNLKMYSVLILFLLFWFRTIHPKYFYKSNFFLKFLVLSERCSDIASFVEHPVYSSLKIYSFSFIYFVLSILNQSECVKVEHPVYNIFEMYSILIIVLFVLPLFSICECVEFNFSWKFRCSGKGAVILTLWWNTLYLAFSKCIVSWF